MKATEKHIKVLEYVQANPGATIEAIAEGTEIFKLQVHKLVKNLAEAGCLIVDDTDEGKMVTATGKVISLDDELPSSKPEKKHKAEKTVSGEDDEPMTWGKRDLTKYKFEGQELGKGQLALAIVKKYVEDRKPSLKELQEIFPDSLVPTYGVVKPIDEAKKRSEAKKRYFIEDHQVVKLADKKVVAVTNQWTTDRIGELVKVVKQLGYKVK